MIVKELWDPLKVPVDPEFEHAHRMLGDEIDFGDVYSGQRYDEVDRTGRFIDSFALQSMAGSTQVYYAGTSMLAYLDYFQIGMEGEEDDEYEFGFGVPVVEFWGCTFYRSLSALWTSDTPPEIRSLVGEVFYDIYKEGCLKGRYDEATEADYEKVAIAIERSLPDS